MPVEIFGWREFLGLGPNPRLALLQTLYDPSVKTFSVPTVPGVDVSTLHDMTAGNFTGTGTVTAIIDTGVIADHPWIKPRLEESVDFTGEGPKDQNGHGTSCCLILIASAPDDRVISLKALDQSGTGKREHLIAAIETAAARKVKVLSMSCGEYTPGCVGDCDVCRAAIRASENGVFVVVAAGNRPGETACPARAGTPTNGILAMGAYDPETMEVARYSGRGEILGPGTVRFGPPEPT
jgi:subtilisin family serine protease